MKKARRFLALSLCLALLCSGCVTVPSEPQSSAPASSETVVTAQPHSTAAPETTRKPAPETTCEPIPETTEATLSANGLPIRWRDGGKMSFLPHEAIEIPQGSELTYTLDVVDFEGMKAAYEALTEKAAICTDPDELLADYYEILPEHQKLETMSAIVYFRFCKDQDSYYGSKDGVISHQMNVLGEKKRLLFTVFAASPCRKELEARYFGDGFFDDYEDYGAVDREYYDLIEDEGDYSYWCEEVSDASYTYIDEYLKAYDENAKYYLDLIKVRQKIAAIKGYQSFPNFAYAASFNRDYTPDQVRSYLDSVKANLVPVAQTLHKKRPELYDGSYPSVASDDDLLPDLSDATEQMGELFHETFCFMEGYELYDVAPDSAKYPISYTSYLPDYEAPILFLSDTEYRTLCHEFGHYMDKYYNYDDYAGYDVAEIYSQAMEYLAVANTPTLSDGAREEALAVTLKDQLLNAILYQAALADFELQVYSLDPETLTVEQVEDVYLQCLKDYDVDLGWPDRYARKHWLLYRSLFSSACYDISYSVSAVAALQISRLEAEAPGAGVSAFLRLLNRTRGKKFGAVLEEAGLDSPFKEKTIRQTADFLTQALNLS